MRTHPWRIALVVHLMLMKSSLVTNALSSGGAAAVDGVPGCAAPASVPAATCENCLNTAQLREPPGDYCEHSGVSV